MSEPERTERGRVRRRLLVVGRVQGVGFRAWTAWTARASGLAGWVLNRVDGAVELEVEGEAGAVDRFREAVGSGPELASVRVVRDLAPSESSLPAPFEVRYR